MTGTILTAVGKAKIASATPEAQLQITHVAVGDGNGSYPVLTENMVALANEVWRGTASTPIRDQAAANTLMFESAIPPDIGGFTIREIAIFDSTGAMIAIGHVDPAQTKPLPTAATAVNMTVRMIIALANAEQTNLVLQVAPVVTHNALADRDIAGAHPASAIQDSSGKSQQTINGEVAAAISYRYTKEETYSRTEVDDLTYSVAGGKYSFTTFAKFDAAKTTVSANSMVNIDEAPTGTTTWGQGLNTWDGTTLSKSVNDSLAQAKDYTNSRTKTTSLNSGNLVSNPQATYLGQGLNSSGVFQTASTFNSIAIAVTEGAVISLLNDRASYIGGAIGAYHSALPPAPENKIANFTVNARTNDQTQYVVSTVPAGAKYLIVNTKSTTNIIWNIQNGAYLDLTKLGKQVLTSLNDNIVFDLDVDTTSRKEGNLNTPSSILTNIYVNSSGVITTGTGFKTLLFPVVEGATYYITDSVGNFNAAMRAVFATSELYPSAFPSVIAYKQTSVDTIKKFTVPTGQSIKYVFLTLKTGAFDVADTLVVHRWRNTDTVPKESISKIKGKSLIDETARIELDALDQTVTTSRFAGKKFVCFGDSITAGTEGGYVKYVESVLRCEVTNKGSSGAMSGRVVDIATQLSAFRDPNTTVPYAAIDYTQFAGASIMIGTNDSTFGITGSLADIPTDSVFNHVGSEVTDYFDLFPNTYYGNVALVIEWIRWKNPLCEIYLISAQRKGNNFSQMDNVVAALKEIAQYYSLPYINATHESGITHKFWSNYSYDLTHMNVTGNKVLGNFIGRKILNS